MQSTRRACRVATFGAETITRVRKVCLPARLRHYSSGIPSAVQPAYRGISNLAARNGMTYPTSSCHVAAVSAAAARSEASRARTKDDESHRVGLAGPAFGAVGRCVLLRWRRGRRATPADGGAGPRRDCCGDSPRVVMVPGPFPATRPVRLDALSGHGAAQQRAAIQLSERRADHGQRRAGVHHERHDAAVHRPGDGIVPRRESDDAPGDGRGAGHRRGGRHQPAGRALGPCEASGNRPVPVRRAQLRICRPVGTPAPRRCCAAQVRDLPAPGIDAHHRDGGRRCRPARGHLRRPAPGPGWPWGRWRCSGPRLRTLSSSRFWCAPAGAT